MSNPKAFFVVSRYSEDVTWIKEYTDNYVVYNKGLPLGGEYKELILPNIGNNQRDIFEFIYRNYDDLPEFIAFLQGNPFDHCKKNKFDRLILNEQFTALESYEDNPVTHMHKKDEIGEYMERNDSWYVHHHYINWGRGGPTKIPSQFPTFNDFMSSLFINYKNLDWIRFSPGSQYIIEKRNALYYPKKFWELLMNILCRNDMAEGHIIERAMWLILSNKYEIKKNIIECSH
jgi:hypothetical protein